MMWGRWQTFGPTLRKRKPLELPEKDRRERARIVVEGAAAILLSAPIFNVGEGDPYDVIEILGTLGPDALPYSGRFDRKEFQRRLLEHEDELVGAALLNQRIVAGLGNYLRAEVLFNCKLNPWLTIRDISQRNINCLLKTIPRLARDAYKQGATAGEKDRKRMAGDSSLVYVPGREYGTRHLVFRRTNLPCLRCGEKIRQLRQRTSQAEENEEERTRIVYFCAKCQKVSAD